MRPPGWLGSCDRAPSPMGRCFILSGGAAEDKRTMYNGDATSDPNPARGEDVLKELRAIISLPKATGNFRNPFSGLALGSGSSGSGSHAPFTKPDSKAKAKPDDKETSEDPQNQGLMLGFRRHLPGAAQVAGRTTVDEKPPISKTQANKKKRNADPTAATTTTGTTVGTTNKTPKKNNPKAKNNPITRAMALQTEFRCTMPSDPVYFGAGWTNHTRYCRRVCEDLTEFEGQHQGGTEEEQAVLMEIGIMRKVVSAIRALCAQVKCTGLKSLKFAEVYDEQIGLLKLKPSVPITGVIPQHLIKSRFLLKISSVKSPEQFWEEISAKAMETMGYKPEEAEEAIKNILIERVLTVFDKPHVCEVADALLHFFPSTSMERFSLTLRLPTELAADVESMVMIANYTSLAFIKAPATTFIEFAPPS